MNNKKGRSMVARGVFYTFITLAFALCIYCFAIVIPEKREAARQTGEEMEKQQGDVTDAPELTATTGPTRMPEATSDPALTATPVPTNTPTPTVTPMPTVTPTPTGKPVPTATMIPTATPVPAAKMKAKVQMGDDAWYQFYEGGILIVAGTGETWDFASLLEFTTYVTDISNKEFKDIFGNVTHIIISDGITRLGDNSISCFMYAERVELPATLEYVGEATFGSLGSLSATGTVEWTGLDLERIQAAATSFYLANGVEDIGNIGQYQATPTPTPTPLPPTPTPTPDPENPKKTYTKQMGDDVTYEVWDNGILYIKGTGATWEASYDTLILPAFSGVKKVIVEEGITYLGGCCLFLYYDEIEFPSTLEKTDVNVGFFRNGHKITAYKDGVKQTVIVAGETTGASRFLNENFGIRTADLE